tara:strand:+ start:137876 stop:138034 length:159 start_codon:yes stop_codon:yes gene_type:complete
MVSVQELALGTAIVSFMALLQNAENGFCKYSSTDVLRLIGQEQAPCRKTAKP